MSLIELDEKNFEAEVIQSNLPVLVDFHANWCGPCQMAAPIIEELAKAYEGKVKIGKVNVDDNSGIAGKFGVMSIPTAIMFVGGKEVNRQVGFGGKDAYEAMIRKVVKS